MLLCSILTAHAQEEDKVDVKQMIQEILAGQSPDLTDEELQSLSEEEVAELMAAAEEAMDWRIKGRINPKVFTPDISPIELPGDDF